MLSGANFIKNEAKLPLVLRKTPTQLNTGLENCPTMREKELKW